MLSPVFGQDLGPGSFIDFQLGNTPYEFSIEVLGDISIHNNVILLIERIDIHHDPGELHRVVVGHLHTFLGLNESGILRSAPSLDTSQ